MRGIRAAIAGGLTAVGLSLTFSGALTSHGLYAAMTLRTSAQADPQQAEALPGLVCVQNALGGVRAFDRVSSLRIVADTKPAASEGPRPLPGTREISVVFPDRYKNVHTGRFPNGGTLSSTTGFDAGAILSNPRGPDADLTTRAAQQDFVRQILMRLPRTLAGVRLSQRAVHDAGEERLALEASGPDGVVTLLADSNTCVPVALQYVSGPKLNVRVDLSEYRSFGGIQFATRLMTTHSGQPYTEERVSLVEVNAPSAQQDFAPR